MVQVHKKFTQFYFLDKKYHYTITMIKWREVFGKRSKL